MEKRYTEITSAAASTATVLRLAHHVARPGDLWMVPRTKEHVRVLDVDGKAISVRRGVPMSHVDSRPQEIVRGDELLFCLNYAAVG